MTAGIALRLGQAAGLLFTRGDHRHRVVIGKDTRLSGYMIEPALTAGFIGAGMDVTLLGPLPTPAIAMLTRSLRADLGVMISASHNPYEDNGIKLFGPDGTKLSDEMELEIEALMDSRLRRPPRGRRTSSAARRGWTTPPAAISRRRRPASRAACGWTGCSIVVDCANGAAYQSRRRCCGNWAPTSSRSASPRTASTSTAAAARPCRRSFAQQVRRARRRSRHRAGWRRRPPDAGRRDAAS